MKYQKTFLTKNWCRFYRWKKRINTLIEKYQNPFDCKNFNRALSIWSAIEKR